MMQGLSHRLCAGIAPRPDDTPATIRRPPSLRRCLLLALGAQATGASADLTFATADRRVQGVLKTVPQTHTEYEPETLDLSRLLEAIAPCGPFTYATPPRFWRQPQSASTFVAVSLVPPAYSIELMGANQSTHHCVRQASWEAARYADGGLAPYAWGLWLSAGLVLAIVGGQMAQPAHRVQRRAPSVQTGAEFRSPSP